MHYIIESFIIIIILGILVGTGLMLYAVWQLPKTVRRMMQSSLNGYISFQRRKRSECKNYT